MIYKKTKMTKKPLCCCDCREWCSVPVECRYNSNFKIINHVMPERCPLVEMPSREDARYWIARVATGDIHLDALLDKLGFKREAGI